MNSLSYLQGYPPSLLAQVQQLIASQQLGPWLAAKYPQPRHELQTDKTLYQYVQTLKNQYLRNAPPVNLVAYDSKISVIRNALGTHTSVSRVQGGKLKAKHEIRIASLFRQAPAEFLRMIVVHELAHLKEKEHNKAFYQLCQHMEPAYLQLELDVRLYLTWLDNGGGWTSAQLSPKEN